MSLTEWIDLLRQDIFATITSIEPRDLAYPSSLILWLIILFYPLRGVDRADPIAGIVYILYSIAAGATLFFALPDNFPHASDAAIHFITLFVMGIITAYRWFQSNNRTLTIEEFEKEQRRNEEFKNAS